MANTLYGDIYDLFMLRIKDHNLVTLYEASESDFNTYLKGFLMLAIPKFKDCSQNLGDRNDTTATFNIELTDVEKDILSMCMVKLWLEKEIQDIKQMNLHIQDRDYRVFSEAQNLKSKQDYKIGLDEELSQKLLEYSYDNNDWSSWNLGNFGG